MAYNPNELEPRWQAYWARNNTFEAREDPSMPKFYALDMFPYPSGTGLHVGHPAGYTASDVVCRLKRAQGYAVLHPMGWDAFGLPAEQKAIAEGIAPQVSTAQAMDNFRRQLQRLGFSYDWSREVSTADPGFYRWTQAIFSLLHRQGHAYEDEALVNWCPELGTVLANDEVIDGRSVRGGFPVERRPMRQWMLRITAFADRLLEGLGSVDWPESTKRMQREWIGRSEGAEVTFPVEGTTEAITVFTTRPDTLWGATYLVLAPEHPLVERVTSPDRRGAVEAYRARSAARSEVERKTSREKTGVDTGACAMNPVNGERVPVWVADYVLAGYGTGAIMAVPGHDERDWAFARALGLPIREVITGGDVSLGAHTGEGQMVNSGPFDGTPTGDREAVRKVVAWLEARSLGRGVVTYGLRDWVFARQRYWGEPIPVLKKDGTFARLLRDDELPLELPAVSDYKPSREGLSPLSKVPGWARVTDPSTGETLEREVMTMPGSAGSSWYFLRFCDPHNTRELCAREKSDYWMPVDLYVGGDEHAVGHLLYARMWQKALKDGGLVRDEEPFKKLRHQGMILGEAFYDPTKRHTPDKGLVHRARVDERDGRYFERETGQELERRVEKMSKSKGNTVSPDEVIDRYGADALRVYLCFLGPLEADKPWQTQGLEGQHTWLKRVWRVFFEGEEDLPRVTDEAAAEAELRALHKAIKKVTRDLEALALNTAVSALHVLTRECLSAETRSRAVLEPFAQLLQPFAPHLAEHLWAHALGHDARDGGISYAPWPAWDERYCVEATVTVGVQVNGRTCGAVELPLDADEGTAVTRARDVASVARHLEGKTLLRVIYKSGRILNLVVK
ncbi:MAG: leucine--tRNA ligase [Deltaproteobacteria bacterium]|nr:leucine--tRNA ligase [Deltaproteobacteria bacterium]